MSFYKLDPLTNKINRVIHSFDQRWIYAGGAETHMLFGK